MAIRIDSTYSRLADLFFDDRALGPGDSIQLSADVYNSLGDLLPGRAVTWSSVNTAVATVSPSGLVIGQPQEGDVGIVATAGRFASQEVRFSVRSHVATITPSEAQLDLVPDQEVVVDYILRDSTDADLGYRGLTFTSTDPAVATVAQDNFATQARITGVGPGTATIVAEREDRFGEVTVVVSIP